MPIITLSPKLIASAEAWGRQSLEEAKKSGQRESHGQNREPLPIRRQGWLGEIAVKLWLGEIPEFHSLYISDTVAGVEVRTVNSSRLGLMVRKSDAKRKSLLTPYILSVLLPPNKVHLRGWLYLHEVMSPANWARGEKLVTQDRPERAWLAPPGSLHSLSKADIETWKKNQQTIKHLTFLEVSE